MHSRIKHYLLSPFFWSITYNMHIGKYTNQIFTNFCSTIPHRSKYRRFPAPRKSGSHYPSHQGSYYIYYSDLCHHRWAWLFLNFTLWDLCSIYSFVPGFLNLTLWDSFISWHIIAGHSFSLLHSILLNGYIIFILLLHLFILLMLGIWVDTSFWLLQMMLLCMVN